MKKIFSIFRKVKFGKSAALWLAVLLIALVVGVMIYFLALRLFISEPIEANVPESSEKLVKEEAIQAEILNGCGVQGIAIDARNYLRSRGFDIIETKNYNKVIEKSIIIDRVGDYESAKKLALAIGISDTLITKQIDSTLFLRASIVLGKDFKELKAFK